MFIYYSTSTCTPQIPRAHVHTCMQCTCVNIDSLTGMHENHSDFKYDESFGLLIYQVCDSIISLVVINVLSKR